MIQGLRRALVDSEAKTVKWEEKAREALRTAEEVEPLREERDRLARQLEDARRELQVGVAAARHDPSVPPRGHLLGPEMREYVRVGYGMAAHHFLSLPGVPPRTVLPRLEFFSTSAGSAAEPRGAPSGVARVPDPAELSAADRRAWIKAGKCLAQE